MLRILLIILIACNVASAQNPRIIFHSLNVTASAPAPSIVAKFNFNTTAQSISGWNDVSGNPHQAIRSATDATSGIGVNSVGTSTTYWPPFASSTSSQNGGESTGNSKFPGSVMASYWFIYSTVSTTEGSANLQITGLNESKTYKLEFFGSRLTANVSTTYRRMNIIVWHNGGSTSITEYDVKGNVSDAVKTGSTIAGGIATFTGLTPKTGGVLNVRLNPRNPVTSNEDFGHLNGLIITEL